MGETRDRMTGVAEPVANPEIEVERAQVDATRTEMSRTIDEIQGRLTPGHLAGQARDSVGSAAAGAGSAVVAAVRENPLPVAIAGACLGYIAYRSFSGPAGRSTRSVGSPARYGSQSRDGVRQAVDTVMSSAGEARAGVEDAASRASMQATEAVGTIQAQATQLPGRLEQSIRANPAGAALVGLGIGAAIGLVLPGSQAEQQVMEGPGKQIRESTQAAASELQRKAEKVVTEAGKAAQEAARE